MTLFMTFTPGQDLTLLSVVAAQTQLRPDKRPAVVGLFWLLHQSFGTYIYPCF